MAFSTLSRDFSYSFPWLGGQEDPREAWFFIRYNRCSRPLSSLGKPNLRKDYAAGVSGWMSFGGAFQVLFLFGCYRLLSWDVRLKRTGANPSRFFWKGLGSLWYEDVSGSRILLWVVNTVEGKRKEGRRSRWIVFLGESVKRMKTGEMSGLYTLERFIFFKK